MDFHTFKKIVVFLKPCIKILYIQISTHITFKNLQQGSNQIFGGCWHRAAIIGIQGVSSSQWLPSNHVAPSSGVISSGVTQNSSNFVEGGYLLHTLRARKSRPLP